MATFKIKSSKNADTRSATGPVSQEMLLADSLQHIEDVKLAGDFLADSISARFAEHDHTKIEHIDEFHRDFTSGAKGAAFKKLPWWQKHLSEHHHLNDRVPPDVDLLDVLEMLADCCMAGLARSGSVYPIELPDEVLQTAFANTQKFILANFEVE